MKVFSTIIGLFLWAGTSVAGTVDPAVLTQIQTQGSADILIIMKDSPQLKRAELIQDRTRRIRYVYNQLRNTAIRSQKFLLEKLQSEKAQFQAFHIVNAVAVTGASTELLQKLQAFTNIQRIQLNPTFTVKPMPVDYSHVVDLNTKLPSNLNDINAGQVWAEFGTKGKGIVIAGHDSGYAWTHPALRSKYRGGSGTFVNHNYNWHDAIRKPLKPASVSINLMGCQPNNPEPCDDSGHGTHTMGSMVGDDGGENQIGVAPDAKWMGCRNMDRGTGKASTYLECFEFFLAPYPRGGDPRVDGNPEAAPHIINNSWACPSSEGCQGNEFIGAVRALKAAGIMVVVSAGNEGPGCSSTNDAPGSYSGEVLSVGAYSNYDKDIASFSSRGPSGFNGGLTPDLIAPGSVIRSSVPSGGSGNGLYDYKSGTSMAGPHAAGVVALLWSARPHLVGKIDQTMQLLKKTSKGMRSSQSCGAYPGNQIPNAVMGYGLIDALNLIRSAPQF